MNVPDVVQALRMMTELSAVSLVADPVLVRPVAEQRRTSGSRPSASRTLLNRPSGETMKIHRIVIAAELAIAGK